MKQFPFIALLLVVVTLASCNKDKRYNVPPEVEVHVQKFKEEAEARGQEYKIKRLIVTYVEGLTNSDGTPIAGRCLKPGARKPELELDANFPNLPYEIQEQLVFHELGHCILERGHKDSYLPNGHFTSVMNSFYWNYLNGQEFKRDYYLDELFDDETAAPAWVTGPTTYDAVDAGNLNTLFDDAFDNNSNNWNLNVGNGHTVSINNGHLIFETNPNSGLGLLRNFNINPGTDYQIEMRMKIISDEEQPNALLWTVDSDNHYFGMSQSEISSIGNLGVSENVISANPCGTAGTDYNIYTVRVIDDKMYYFINHNFFDYRILPAHQVSTLGFFVGNNAHMEVDHLNVSEITP